MQIWKDIVGYEGLYQVSDFGMIKSLPRLVNRKHGKIMQNGKILILSPKENGYLFIALTDAAGGKKCFYIHRLVATHFIPNPEGKPEVNHKYNDKKDNRATSLEWVTRSENLFHSFKNGSHKPMIGTKSPRAKLTDEKVIDIKSIYQAGGISIRKLAEDYGVHHSVINGILQGKRWPHIKPT